MPSPSGGIGTRDRDYLGHFAEVLGCGGKVELVFCSIGTAQAQAIQLQHALEMREHGIEGEKWRHGAAAIEDNLSRQIQAHEIALSRLKAEPDDRRLALMADAQQAASKLDAEAFARLPERQRRELQEIGEKLRERTNQERLREIRAREAQREQDLWRAQNLDRGDPRHHQ